jgi:uncharacterized SAM-binding protein YcdF (DUF218 family)
MSCIRRILALIVVFLVICGLLLGLSIFKEEIQTAIGNFLIVEDNLYPADVIHVIAGDDSRTEYAIQLYQQGFARKIFFTGGWCTQHGYYHGEHGLQLALAGGVPLEDIAYDDTAVLSTFDETVLLKNYLASNLPSAQSVIVVSDPFHMRRTRWINDLVFGNQVKTIMQPVPFDQTPFKQEWWTDKPSRAYVREEYTKMFYDLFRYKLGWDWLAFLDKNE